MNIVFTDPLQAHQATTMFGAVRSALEWLGAAWSGSIKIIFDSFIKDFFKIKWRGVGSHEWRI